MTATEHIDPTKAVGRLLVAGWHVLRKFTYEGGVLLIDEVGKHHHFDHGELVEVVIEDAECIHGLLIGDTCAECGVVIEDTPADDVTGAVRQAVQ